MATISGSHDKKGLNIRQDRYDFEATLVTISDEILKDELNKMLFLLSEVIPGRKREEITEAYQVFAYLKARGLIEVNKVTYLVNLLKDIKRDDLAKKLDYYNSNEVKTYKCIVVGESFSGKTALTVRLMYNSFPEEYTFTVSPDCLKRNIYLEEKLVPVEMWDTAGMETLSNILPDNFFRDVSVVLLVFDITDIGSFAKTSQWNREVKLRCADDIVLLLVGNKLDLNENRAVNTSMGKRKAAEIGAQYMEVSAKEGKNTDSILTEIAKALPLKDLSFTNSFPTTSSDASTQTPTPGLESRIRKACHC